MHFIGHLKRIHSLKTSALQHRRRTGPHYVAMYWNGGLVEVRCHHMHYVSSAQHVCAYRLFLDKVMQFAWWRHQMETFSALLAICAGNSPVTSEFPTQRQVTRSFDVFFDLRLNKRLSKQSWGWWFETLSSLLWRHCNGLEKLFFLQNFFRQIQAQTVKICMALFSSYGNKGLIYTMIAAHRVYLFTEAILLQAKLCNVYRVYCLNYILNELEAKLKNIKFVSKILQWNQFSHRRICIMKYIQIHCQLSKFTTQDIPL